VGVHVKINTGDTLVPGVLAGIFLISRVASANPRLQLGVSANAGLSGASKKIDFVGNARRIVDYARMRNTLPIE